MSSDNDDRLAAAGQEALTRAQRILDWWDQFDRAWEALEALALVDGIQGRQYHRVAGSALHDDVEANQTALRVYILAQACNNLTKSETALSLMNRAKRTSEKERKTDDTL